MSDPIRPVSLEHLDYIGLLRSLWVSRYRVLAATLLGAVLAGIYAFAVAKPVFKSTILLVPTSPPKLDQLGAASALLGKKSTTGNADADLYQGLLTSRTVIQKLLISRVDPTLDTTSPSPRHIWEVMGVDTSNPLDRERFLNQMQRSISVSPATEGGIVEVGVSAEKPWLAKQLADNLIGIGQEEIRSVRIDRSNALGPRLAAATESARREWDSSAARYATFAATNRSLTLPGQILQAERLLIDKQAKEQKYLLARRETETQLLEQEKAAAPMVVLDPANLPARKSKPKRVVLLLAGALAFFFGSCLYYTSREPFKLLLGRLSA